MRGCPQPTNTMALCQDGQFCSSDSFEVNHESLLFDSYASVPFHIWLGCGDTVNLNYTQHSAAVSHTHRVRKHFQAPTKDKPIGTATIAGLTVTGWPVHFSNGTGAMWFDMTNGVVAKSEAHLKGSNGTTTDYVKQLQSINLTSVAVDPPETKLPANFTLSTQPGSPPSCENIEPASQP